MKKVLQVIGQVLASLAGVALFVGFLIFSSSTGKVTPCTTSYIKGEYSIATLKVQCPNLSKDNVKKAVNEYFDGNFDYPAHASQQEMLDDIDKNF